MGGINDPNQIDKPQSFSKGIIVNFLSPNPYLFWITVGGPTMVKGWAEYQLAAVMFVIVFWICLVGSKMFMAVLTGTSRHRISGRPYLCLMRILGLLLVFYALLLMKDGLGLLSII